MSGRICCLYLGKKEQREREFLVRGRADNKASSMGGVRNVFVPAVPLDNYTVNKAVRWKLRNLVRGHRRVQAGTSDSAVNELERSRAKERPIE